MTRRHFIWPNPASVSLGWTITPLTAVSGSFTSASSTAGYGLSTAAANRYIFLGIVYGTNTGDPTSVTIGGVTATLLAKGSNGSRTCAIYVAAVPTGATGTVTIGASNNGHTVAYTFFCWAVYGAVNTTPKAFNAASGGLANGTTANSQNGGAVFMCANNGGTFDSALTSDATVNNTVSGQNLQSCDFAHSQPTGPTITVGDSATGASYAYVSMGG